MLTFSIDFINILLIHVVTFPVKYAGEFFTSCIIKTSTVTILLKIVFWKKDDECLKTIFWEHINNFYKNALAADLNACPICNTIKFGKII